MPFYNVVLDSENVIAIDLETGLRAFYDRP